MLTATKELFTRPSGGYQISRSVRTRSSASAYFNKTFTTPTGTTKWTWSGWVKRGTLGVAQTLFSGQVDVNNWGIVAFLAGDTLSFQQADGGSVTSTVTTTQVFRDPSAWYHLVVAFDSTQATAANRLVMYVNGVQITAFGTATYLAQNTASRINAAVAHQISRYISAAQYFDGYLTEINFVDGQALTPPSFGETDAITGVWKPKKYTGTYGTNGFYLNFSDNSNNTATTIGKDYSGNGNNWTPNNISVTAGTTYDSMLDVPTPYADGGNGRGNYCVLNALNNTGTLSNANLTFTGTDKATVSTIEIPTSGKYYFEATCTTVANLSTIGIANVASQASVFNGVIASANFRTYNSGGEKADSTRTASWGSTFTSGDVIGVAVDMDNGAIYFAKNNTWQASGVPTSGASKTGAAFTDLISSGITWTPIFSAQNISGVWNPTFGQRPFSYTPPSGFKALNTQNLPDSTIKKGALYMQPVLYIGTSPTSKSVTGVGFQPDFTWIKGRVTGYGHALFDAIRGANNRLQTNATGAEAISSTYLTSFDSDGFTAAGDYGQNAPGEPYVSWNWNAGGSTVTNTSGSISAQVRANPAAGFSVVTYTGTGANATVGHGLGVAPKMIIIKRRDASTNWPVWHTSISSGTNDFIQLNLTTAKVTDATFFTSTAPTSTVFSVGTGSGQTNSGTVVAYCWAEVAGFSKFGSYTGNGSTDGPFVYCGFRPRFIIWKASSGADNWVMTDTSRSPYNAVYDLLLPNSSAAESTYSNAYPWDFLSNGFKIRHTASNVNGTTYIYAAFAENPFKNALAR